MTNHDAELNIGYHHGGQQQAEYEPSSFSNQFINTVGPDLSIPGQYDSGQSAGAYKEWQQNTQPPLYGQDQLHDGLGPVYATPSFPSPQSAGQGAGGYQGWQQDTHPPLYGQNQLHDGFGPVYATPSFPSPQSAGQGVGGYQGWQQDTNPPLHGQNQLQGGFGPVYATPPFPSQHGHGQGMVVSQWQQGCKCSHPQPIVPYYMYPPYGHQPCQ